MTAPDAPCRLVPPGRGHRTHYLAVVPECPLCGRQHTHGAGVDGDRLGHRCAHCTPRRVPRTDRWEPVAGAERGYVLVRGEV